MTQTPRPTQATPEPDFSANDAGDTTAIQSHDGPKANNTAAQKPFKFKSDAVAGVALLEDRRYKQMQFQFDEKPSDGVRKLLRDAGYTWQPADRVWVQPIDRKAGWMTRLDAEKLFDRIVESIAQDRGAIPSR
jgi:hypothetical protein